MTTNINVSHGNIGAFDAGYGPQFGSIYRIQRNESITRVKMWLAHLPLSQEAQWSSRITTTKGRSVRAAIWIVDDKWNICKKPDYISSEVVLSSSTSADNGINGVVNTDLLPIIESENDYFTECTFTFNTGEIDATLVCIGLLSNESTVTSSAIAYRKTSTNTVYYADAYMFNISNPERHAKTSANAGICMACETWSALKDTSEVRPMLKLKNVKYRTLSYQTTQDADGTVTHSATDIPPANWDDKYTIRDLDPNNTTQRVQWDTAEAGGAFARYEGFDFHEGDLKDVILFNNESGVAYNNITNYNSSTKPFWVHSRSRILLKFDPWNSLDDSEGYSRIRYEVSGAGANAKPSAQYYETRDRNTTLLICPRDEGIEDNEVMELTIYRQRYSSNDKPVGQEVSMKLIFNTFVTPSIRIAHPKPHRNKDQNGNFETKEHNYVLWANDYMLDTSGEDTSTGEQICDVLDMLLTKDGGDNSGYPIFTRFSILEFNCNVGSNSSTGTAANIDVIKRSMETLDSSIRGSVNPTSMAECTAYYTGLQLDDGSLIQLSGMIPNGFNWDWMRDAAENINPQKEEAVHKVITDHDAQSRPLYSRDWRICFRAGFKYYIRVRRFHSAVAGAIGAYKGTNKVTIPYVDGGVYRYYEGSDYGGAEGTLAHDNNRNLDYKCYPTNDDINWLTRNNHLISGRWVGPVDGSGGRSLTDPKVDVVYPGFSNVDTIIVDCLPALSSQSNIIMPRPANQEIGADKWVTFAYKHLSKSFNGVNQWCGYNPGKLSGKQNSDGTYISNGGTMAMRLPNGSSYTGTWGGNANTMLRIYQMYKHLVDYTAAHIDFDGTKAAISDIGDCGYVTRKRVVIRLDRQLPKESEGTYQHPYHDEYTTSSVILADYIINGDTTTTSVPANGYRDLLAWKDLSNLQGINTDEDDGNAKAARIYFDPHASSMTKFGQNANKPCYGNTYTWVPIINAATTSTRNGQVENLTVAGAVTTQLNDVNKIVQVTGSIFTNHSEYANTPGIDTRHALYDHNKWEPGKSYNKTTKTAIHEYSGQITHPGDTGGGLLYTTLGDVRSKGSSENFDWFTSTDPDLDQSCIPTDMNIPNDYGTGGMQYFNSDSNQRTPGELYKRIPVAFDCENGQPTWNRKLSPLSDIVSPIVRTSHMLYFKTYIFGRISYEVFYEYTPGNIEYDGMGNEYKVYGESTTTLPAGSAGMSFDSTLTDAWADEVASSTCFNKLALGMDNIGNKIIDSNTYTFQILTVYGEDNGGNGMCLSADDDTAVWFGANGTQDMGPAQMDGAIEYPIRVRYTPLVQPIITRDAKIAGTGIDVSKDSTSSRHVFNLERYYTTCNTTNKNRSTLWSSSNSDGSTKFTITVSYGMYNSAYGGRYVTARKKDQNRDNELYMNPIYQRIVNRKFINTADGTIKELPTILSTNSEETLYTPGNVRSIDTSNGAWVTDHLANTANTDIYPSVGICNCFTILLIPSDIGLDYTRQTPNWFANRANYWNLRSSKVPAAGPVVVAEKQFTQSYKAPGNKETPTITTDLTSIQTDHQLRTIYQCEFDFTRLVDTGVPNGSSSANGPEHRVQVGVDYDLVVIPVYSNKFDESSSTSPKMFNFKHATSGYIDATDASMGVLGQYYGSDQDDGGETNGVDYYGSTPLVVNKFITIANISDNSGKKRDSSGKITDCPPPDPDDDPPPTPSEDYSIYTDPAIIYPNVNNVRFNSETGEVRECPGFWLNNTFRVILRGPHFRTKSQITKDPSSSAEVSIEEMTGSSKVAPADYKFTDIQIHFGKYNGPVLMKNGDEWVESSVDFTDPDFQKELNDRKNDKEWLNERNIYSMSCNSDAFSKCTPAQKIAPPKGDSRDIILGGGFKPGDKGYSDRFVEFNPNIVNAGTAYPEGYYIQFRFLSDEYKNNGKTGKWSGWYSGFINDNVKDTTLSYCVPVRNFNSIYTEFRHHIKESYPGSALIDIDLTSSNSTLNHKPVVIPGVGSLSNIPVNENDDSYTIGSGNADDTPIVPSKTIPTPGNWNNTDYSYAPQIWNEINQYTANSAKYPIPTTIYDKHQVYWEMNYIDYIIRNMAKLYYSEWSGAYIPEPSGSTLINITPQDFGWTKSMYSAYKKWNVGVVNEDTRGTPSSGGGSAGQPENRDRYFRRPIRKDDFEELLKVLQNITTFIRQDKFTGTHTSSNDDKGSHGLSVLPIWPDLLTLDTNVNKNNAKERGMIGTTLEHEPGTAADHTYMAHTRTTSNYLQHLWTNIISGLCNNS